jgi:putative two-component system response regulator
MSPMKILIVEDDRLSMELVTDLLEAEGYQVLNARTAEEGIRAAGAEQPHLILMDISLPGMTGATATMILRNNKETEHIPVVAMTAHAMKGDKERAEEFGFTGYITKPIDPVSLLEYIADTLRLIRADKTDGKTSSRIEQGTVLPLHRPGSGSKQQFGSVGKQPGNRILVVDDDERNLELMEAMLIPLGYRVELARDGREALVEARKSPPDLILLDVMMPGMDGYEVVRQLKRDKRTGNVPIVMVTALVEVEDKVKALEAGADDFLSKPVEEMELQARVKSLLKVKAYNDHLINYQQELETEVQRRTEQLRLAAQKIEDAYLDTVLKLAKAAEFRDTETGAHVVRVGHYAANIAKTMGLGDKVAKAIMRSAPMHDVGKIGIPDFILLKPGPLDYHEREIMKQHTIIGGRILEGSRNGLVKLCRVIALSHHERWDGHGYPYRLKGTEAPLAGRITAVADVFDALVSRRPYKESFATEKAFNTIHKGSGTQFDPQVVAAFFDCRDKIVETKEQYPDDRDSPLIRFTQDLAWPFPAEIDTVVSGASFEDYSPMNSKLQ